MGEIFSRQINSPPFCKGLRLWRKEMAARPKVVQSSKVVMPASTDMKEGWVREVTLVNLRFAAGMRNGYTGVEQQHCGERRVPKWHKHIYLLGYCVEKWY